MGRIACAWIPRFELAVHLRADAALAARPVLLADVARPRARVIDATAAAIAQGARPGLPLASARALCPKAAIVPPDPARVAAEGDRVVAALYRLAPRVGRDGRGAFFLALEGLGRLHPDERAFARKVRDEIAALGYRARVAVADALWAAWVAAQASDGVVVVPPGGDARALAHLPAPALPMPEPIAELCLALGIKTVGDLQALPRGSLARRFGAEGAALERAARAEAAGVFRAEAPAPPDRAALELDLPLSDLEPLLFLAKTVLDRLLFQVAQGRRALAALEVWLRLDDRSLVRHLLRPAAPTLAARPLLELLRLWLSSRPLCAAVSAITLVAAEVAEADRKQLRLFARQADQAGEAVAQALARLWAAFGPKAAGWPALADTWRPEARVVWRTAEGGGSESGEKARLGPSLSSALHGFAALRTRADPPPVELSGRSIRIGGARAQRLAALDGPYRVQGEWWSAPFERDYFVAATEDGGVYWIYREGGAVRLGAVVD